MQIHKEVVDGITILRLKGRIESNELDELRLRSSILEFLNEGGRHIIIDMKDVPWCSNVLLAEVSRLYNSLRKVDGEMRIVSPSKRVKDLLVLTKLDTVFRIYYDESAALKSFETR